MTNEQRGKILDAIGEAIANATLLKGDIDSDDPRFFRELSDSIIESISEARALFEEAQ